MQAPSQVQEQLSLLGLAVMALDIYCLPFTPWLSTGVARVHLADSAFREEQLALSGTHCCPSARACYEH